MACKQRKTIVFLALSTLWNVVLQYMHVVGNFKTKICKTELLTEKDSILV
jgi:hypothetical protein